MSVSGPEDPTPAPPVPPALQSDDGPHPPASPGHLHFRGVAPHVDHHPPGAVALGSVVRRAGPDGGARACGGAWAQGEDVGAGVGGFHSVHTLYFPPKGTAPWALRRINAVRPRHTLSARRHRALTQIARAVTQGTVRCPQQTGVPLSTAPFGAVRADARSPDDPPSTRSSWRHGHPG